MGRLHADADKRYARRNVPYYFLGHDEQIIAIVPSRELVIVRLGLTPRGGAWDHAKDLAPIVSAFPPRER